MWNWKPEKRILEDLFAAGEVVVAGRDGFQRLYALPEQVIPREHLDAPAPSEDEFRRGYALRAVQARGALTESGIAEHCRVPGRREGDAAGRRRARRRGARPPGRGRGRRRAGRRPRRRGASTARPPAASSLCPFDNLVWDRAFLERVFGFRHVIEVYKRGARARVRLLRAAVPPPRPAGRPRRPEVRPGRGRAPGEGVPPRAEGAARARARSTESLGAQKALARLAKVLGLEQVAHV